MSATTDRPARVQVIALNDLGVLQRETGDYSAAEASHQQALQMLRDQGNRLGQAEALNRLGELSCRTSATDQAHERHVRALTIARDIGVPFEEARALEGLGMAHLHDGDTGEATTYLGKAFSIYQRIGAHAAQRVEDALRPYGPDQTTPQPGHD
jgi:tetratricopeptide (TPR) repeat protein